MSLRWTRTALADLDAIFAAIAQDRPRAAERVIMALLSLGGGLLRHPRQGRPGRLHQTRELAAPRLPYVIVYALSPSLIDVETDVTILRVVHGAMRWPPEVPPQ
ncbi:MAG: type II toxin-antitoxin system mRNA interferase toxin, RelE/StbE family [Elusimicrobia bacterium CG11_big_fil_rev_8_21_14_0_20_64_6]|nr:MAG: type II toxin-antitoxin system mRNA interferase toxin, RelE/StbE family [Elusimicrobia bacterium CG11_big_fil_rev_8_21_14_0_20_64_6]